MTTIAYRDGVLAADTLLCDGNGMRAGFRPKIGKTGDGALWGLTGLAAGQEAWVRWAEGDRRGEPPEVENGEGILIEPDGRVRRWARGGWTTLNPVGGFYAWGSGWEVATGAMLRGATATEAVEDAITIDTCSGGDITALKR